MKSQKITRNNYAGKKLVPGDVFPVLSKHYNDMQEDVDFLSPLTDQIFRGEINMERVVTYYQNYVVDTNLEVTISKVATIGAGAEIRLIADGSHTPNMSAFTKSATSYTWSTVAGKIHKTIFYNDGTEVFYSHIILNP